MHRKTYSSAPFPPMLQISFTMQSESRLHSHWESKQLPDTHSCGRLHESPARLREVAVVVRDAPFVVVVETVVAEDEVEYVVVAGVVLVAVVVDGEVLANISTSAQFQNCSAKDPPEVERGGQGLLRY
jgi:hypothetical protein